MESFTKEDTMYISSVNGRSREYNEGLESRKVMTILSEYGKTVIESIFFVTIGGPVGVLGIIANVINIVVFCKQGLNNTVNIAFFGLATSDLFCLTFLLSASICMNPLFTVYDVPMIPVEVMYITSAWPHVCFCRITSYITVYITGERCLSIMFPLKVKQLVTKTRATLIIILIYVVNLMTVVPEWITSNLGWRFVEEKNRTLLAVIFTRNRKSVEGCSFFIHSVFSITAFIGVVFLTFVLVIKLKQNSQIRKELTSGHDRKASMSDRDKRVVKMIVLIAVILIVCYIPGAIVATTTFIVGPEFMIQGGYINICSSVWSIAFSFQSINSSVNIFLYYRMSSKYRATLQDFFNKCAIDRK